MVLDSLKKIAVLGAGSWGTALALVLADNKHEVRLWGHREEHVSDINEKRENAKYLPGVTLPTNIITSSNIEYVLQDVDAIVVSVPSKAIREVIRKIKPYITPAMKIVHVSKGIEPDTLCRISEMIAEELDNNSDIVVLSGPSHAEEVGRRQPTTVTVSSTNMRAAEYIQDLFINQHFRVYTNPDVVGVEIGGALKNIIALGAGITDGLNFGDNAKAALITRGLAEISRLGTKMGANPLTFAGLTGIGDLIVTCTSSHSRNWRAGNMLGSGMDLQEVLDNMGMVVEGVRTTKAAYQLAQKEQVDMPITNALYQVLFNNMSTKDAVDGLMGRVRKHEMEDLAIILDEKK